MSGLDAVFHPIVWALRALGVLALATFIVCPALPGDYGGFKQTIAGWERQVSVKQQWRMYAPNPSRSQTYMNLTAVYGDDTRVELEETVQERGGWGTHWLWDKTRADIWRYYANFNPKKRNINRTWYLKGVCVREARRGPIPDKISMEHVKRRFAPPDRVRQGTLGLGRPIRRMVTVQYCKAPEVRKMIEADRARREIGPEIEDAPIPGRGQKGRVDE